MVQIDTDVMRIARESIGRTSPVETYATTDERNLKTSVGASAAAGYLAAIQVNRICVDKTDAKKGAVCTLI